MAATYCDIPVDVVKIAGPVLVGSQLNWGLFGILTVQLYMYAQGRRNDHPYIRGIVYGIYAFEAVQTVLLTHDVFQQLAFSFGNYKGLIAPYLTGFELVIQPAIIATVTQCFYAWHIHDLTRSKIVPAIIVFISLVQCGGGFSEGIAVFVHNSTSATIPAEERSVAIWIGGSAGCDILITISMAYLLWSKRNGTKQTDNVVDKIIQLFIETGALTAALAVVQLVLYVYFRHTEYFMTPAGALSKAYSNSLLVVINNRREARDPRSGPGNDLTLPPQLTSTRAIQINVNQETFAEGNMAVVNLSTDDKYEEYPTKGRP
ncbi:hypothetical protein C8Q72DRAFT_889289 [Fomitopsis betulina]|nr:hypothetical protein C8Q72DRAFT_889289 [Fomitopsis betulina]